MTEEGALTIAAVGDVIIMRPEPDSMFRSTGAVLRASDITFGNCETPYSEPAPRNPIARGALLGSPASVPALAGAAGFNVMSFANNHHLDYGYPAFARTLELLHENGIATCGAGANIEEARMPAIIESHGVRVGFLAYNSISLLGFEAGPEKPGAAPLRAHTVYEQVEQEQPGTKPDIWTYPNYEDLAAMVEDVKKAREQTDVLIFTCHWGLHYIGGAIADYERVIARAAIDAGADLVLGHHQHVLRGVDTYRGKLIFHGLGNFAYDLPLLEGDITSPRLKAMTSRYAEDVKFGDPEYPRYPFSVDARKTMIVRISVRDRAIDEVEILPCIIERDNTPRLLQTDEGLHKEVVDYLKAVGEEADLKANYGCDGDRVLVRPVQQ
jgi:hypothetical protein